MNLTKFFFGGSEGGSSHSPAKLNSDQEKRISHLHNRLVLREQAQQSLDFLAREVLKEGLIIDSNIWMNEKYDPLFQFFEWLVFMRVIPRTA